MRYLFNSPTNHYSKPPVSPVAGALVLMVNDAPLAPLVEGANRCDSGTLHVKRAPGVLSGVHDRPTELTPVTAVVPVADTPGVEKGLKGKNQGRVGMKKKKCRRRP